MQARAIDHQRAQLILAAGAVALAREEYSTAERWLDEALLTFQKLGDPRGEADSLRMLGELAAATGKTTIALARYQEAYRTYLVLGDASLAEDCQGKAGLAQIKERVTHATAGRTIFEENLPLIQQLIDLVARRSGLTQEELDDFSSEALVKFIEDDFRILRHFEGRSSLRNYLQVLILRQLSDYRDRAWGKFRSSSEARRYGEAGLLLERLISKDGLSLSEAISLVQVHASSTKQPISEGELVAIAARLPQRVRRQIVDESALRSLPSEETPDQSLERKEQVARARAVTIALKGALERLSAEDRILIRMRYFDNLTIAEIARMQRVDQKALYRHVDVLWRRLRKDLASYGVSPDDAFVLIDSEVL